MRPLLRSELIKLRTTRTFYALAGVTIGLGVIFVCLGASLSDPTKDSVVSDVFEIDTSSFFILMLAIVGITGEWRHRTITSSLLAAPDRTKFLAAKVLAFAAAGGLLSIAISVVTAVIGCTILSFRDLPLPDLADLLDLYGRNAVVALLLGGVGVGIGSLIRNQPIAIVGVLIFGFAIDPLIAFYVPEVERFSPISALPNAIQGLSADEVGIGGVDLFGFWPALGLMLAWIGVLFAAGAALLKARDVD